jgi:hypothetical protein
MSRLAEEYGILLLGSELVAADDPCRWRVSAAVLLLTDTTCCTNPRKDFEDGWVVKPPPPPSAAAGDCVDMSVATGPPAGAGTEGEGGSG